MSVACSAPPNFFVGSPAKRIRRDLVGSDLDFTAYTGLPPAPPISTAVGSFPAVTGVTSVTSPGNKRLDGPNSYSLQLNSNQFATKTCTENHLQYCQGWEQFVYFNPSGSRKSYLFMEYWLLSAFGESTTARKAVGIYTQVVVGSIAESLGYPIR